MTRRDEILGLKIKIIKFESNEIADSFAKKISKLMTDITWGVKQGKSFEVAVREVEDEHQSNPENT
jgi:pyruvoyl-dependent arginine decarboxylase (PvlArgDC)